MSDEDRRDNFMATDKDIIVFPSGVKGFVMAACKRPRMYVRDRECFLNLMWGILIGHAGFLPVPGWDFKKFEVDMDKDPDWEWTKSIQDYMMENLDDKQV